MKVLVPAIAVCAAIGVFGCGNANSSANNSSQATATAPLSDAVKRFKRQVRIPEGPPPKALVRRDLIEGTGPIAKLGREVRIQFAGFDYKTGKVVAVPWNNRPSDWKLGTHWVLPGVEKGVLGMKAGGRRELIIPPRLAFGPDSPPKIAPNATIVYVIDLLKVE